MFYGITDLPAYIVGAIVIILLPGPNSLYILTTASRWGVAAGYRGAAGVFVGDAILIVLSAAGVASVLKTSPKLFMAVKYAGAGYLAWVGFGLLRSAASSWLRRGAPDDGQVQEITSVSRGCGNPFRTALVVSLMNPKAILFYISFFIQFVTPGYEHPALSFLILGMIVEIVSLVYLSALIFGGAALAQAFRRHRRMAAVGTGTVGAVFLGFSVKLATATLG